MMPSLDGKMESKNGNSEDSNAKNGKSNTPKSAPIPSEEVFVNIMKNDFGKKSKKKKEEKIKMPSVPYRKLYRYADKWDYVNIIVGTITGIIHGVGLPVMFVFFGELTNQFTQYGRYEQCLFTYNICHRMNLTTINQSEWDRTVQVQLDSFKQTNIEFVLYFIYIACGVFVFGSVQVATWSIQATRQAKRLRASYFKAILRQDIGFHDVTPSGELHSMLSSDIKRVKDGIGEKVSMVIQYVSMTFAGLVISLLYAWKLALVTLAAAPLLVLSGALLFILSDVYTRKELQSYAKAGAVAKEAISSIRTVTAFGGQSSDVDRYAATMKGARLVGIKRGFISGFSIGLMYISMFGMYGLSFWYGSMLVIADEITAGELTTSFFGILIASFALGTAGAYVGTFSEATAAATKLFQVIDRVPEIDVFSDDGTDPDPENCELSFHDVSFSYPSRPETEVLDGISFKVGRGETVALVGQSGSGKSTIIQLIQRFYDPISGKITIGGRNLRTLSVNKLRDMIGVVSQEPVLFEASIAENIRWGCVGVTDKQVKKAARSANAYNFIKKLPKGFNTLVGEGGGQLSGGQKQRIAIARAIVRDPKILLLDEATSALDVTNESAVQTALQNASANRITVIIAHRLTTIRYAHKILVLQEGRIVEEGSHDQLLKTNGLYKNLTRMQVGMDHEREKQTKEHIIDPTRFMRDSTTSQKGSQRASNRWNRTWSSRILLKENAFSLIPSNFAKEIILNDSSSPYQSLRKRLDGGSISSYHSVFSASEPDDEKPEDDKDLAEVSFGKLLMINKPEWLYMAGGSIFAAIAGSVDPINAIVFANVLNIFIMNNPLAQIERAKLYGLLFLALGCVSFIAFTAEATLFAKSGIELTLRLRKKTFQSILRQNIAFFDDHANSTGTLCNRLSSDAARVQGSTGGRVGIIVKNLSSLGVALGIGFWFSWKLTLVTLAFVPFIVIGGIIEMHLIIGEEGSTMDTSDADQLASQVIENIRTVASLRSEHMVHQRYLSKLSESLRKVTHKALLIGVGYGYSQCVIFLVFAATFRLGIELVESGEVNFASVFKVLSAVFFGAMAIGQNSSFAPDYAEAKLSASRLFALFDKQPIIDAHSRKGHSPAHCKGTVTLKSVYFRYPARPDVLVLDGCDVTIECGKTLALVGQSGCGKSTVIQLLERFYDPKAGQVLIDDYDVKKLNVSWLRNRIGLVSQEPVLFDRSIKENIRYGDNTRAVDDDEVMEAARKANADQFIQKLNQGYDTRVGEQGNQLSGGQKQRIAIARALLRNPKILLLDEATSALDSQNETIVQEALDKARSGRTTIVVAHRLSTVKNADKIAVIDRGRIVEVGTHSELLSKKRTYYSLVNAQLSPSERENFTTENTNSTQREDISL